MLSPDALPLVIGEYKVFSASDEPEWYLAKKIADKSEKILICKIIDVNKPNGASLIACHSQVKNSPWVNPIIDCLNVRIPEECLQPCRASSYAMQKSPLYAQSPNAAPLPSDDDKDSLDPPFAEPQNNSDAVAPGPIRNRSSTCSSTDSLTSVLPKMAANCKSLIGEQVIDHNGQKCRDLNLVFLENQSRSLHSYVRERRKLAEEEAKEIFLNIVDILHECHRNGICLRDLKMRKLVWKEFDGKERLILENLDNAILLGDFTDDRLYDRQGTPAYCCPEMLRSPPGNSYSGLKADIWCLGVVLYSMTAGRYPYHDVEPMRMITKIRRGYRVQFPTWLTSRARSLMANLLHQDASKRISLEDIRTHPWISRNESVATPSPRRLLETLGAKHGAFPNRSQHEGDDSCVPETLSGN